MGSLIFAYCLGALFVLPLLGLGRLDRMVSGAGEEHLRGLRRYAESRWFSYYVAVWAFLTAVGAVFTLIRGYAIGWAWLGAAALYTLGVFATRLHSRRLLEVLGDRGRVDMPDRYKQRASRSYRFAAVGVTGYIGMKVMGYAYPHDIPTWAQAVRVGCAVVLIVGVVGFLVIRLRMYLAGDDLQPTGG